MATVSVSYQKNLQHIAKIRNHTMVLDEPKDVGGDDKGPSPYESMLAALGACTSMTMLMYAGKKGWQVDKIDIDLSHSRIHAKDCETCETKEGQLDKITRTIRIKGNINEEQKNKLLEIAEKCPVHRTLTREILVVDDIEMAA